MPACSFWNNGHTALIAFPRPNIDWNTVWGAVNPKTTYLSGPSCSKLTTSLVNVSLNFQKLISQICQYFLLKNCEKLLQCFSHFFHKKFQCILLLSCKTLNKLTFNELTMLWTTGPWLRFQLRSVSMPENRKTYNKLYFKARCCQPKTFYNWPWSIFGLYSYFFLNKTVNRSI